MTATEPVADLRVCRACRQAKPLESFRLVEARYRSHTCEQCKYRQRVARTKTQTLAKLCTKCGVLKGIADFSKTKTGTDGYQTWCKACHARLPSRSTEGRQAERSRRVARIGCTHRTRDDRLAFRAARRIELRLQRELNHSIAEAIRPLLWSADLHCPGMTEKQARHKVSHGTQLGWVTRPAACSDCGHKPPRHRLHAHHDNYEYPLRVEWLCADCHAALHGHVC